MFLHMELHAFYNLVHHSLSVEHGELLDDLHVMDILVKEFSRYIRQCFGDIGLFKIFSLLQLFLDLFSPAFRLHLRDESLDGGVVGAVEDLVARFLIVTSHLHPQVAATRMNHQIEVPCIILIHLNKMVAAP